MASGRVLLPPPREPWSGMRAGRYHVHPGGWPLRPAFRCAPVATKLDIPPQHLETCICVLVFVSGVSSPVDLCILLGGLALKVRSLLSKLWFQSEVMVTSI